MVQHTQVFSERINKIADFCKLTHRTQVFSKRINEIADRLFKPFSEKLGLSSVREYEEQHQAFEAKIEAEKARLNAQVRMFVRASMYVLAHVCIMHVLECVCTGSTRLLTPRLRLRRLA